MLAVNGHYLRRVKLNTADANGQVSIKFSGHPLILSSRYSACREVVF